MAGEAPIHCTCLGTRLLGARCTLGGGYCYQETPKQEGATRERLAALTRLDPTWDDPVGIFLPWRVVSLAEADTARVGRDRCHILGVHVLCGGASCLQCHASEIRLAEAEVAARREGP